jgi:hypothetical protein
MTQIMTSGEIAGRFRALAATHGESVWEWQVVLPKRRFSLPHSFTSSMAYQFEDWPLTQQEEDDPDGWIADWPATGHCRLFLRAGEGYDEAGQRYRQPPLRLELKSPDEFLYIRPLARDQWWQAPFVCPFCEAIITCSDMCDHALAQGTALSPKYRNHSIASLIKDMRDNKFNCNLGNGQFDGVKIKMPRNLQGGEWFRSAYWYVINANALDALTRVGLRARQSVEVVEGE